MSRSLKDVEDCRLGVPSRSATSPAGAPTKGGEHTRCLSRQPYRGADPRGWYCQARRSVRYGECGKGQSRDHRFRVEADIHAASFRILPDSTQAINLPAWGRAWRCRSVLWAYTSRSICGSLRGPIDRITPRMQTFMITRCDFRRHVDPKASASAAPQTMLRRLRGAYGSSEVLS